MSFHSQLFWVSMFMQQLEYLNSLEVAIRLLPQALVGLLLSPLVGLFMHAIPGTGLLVCAASALVLSNILLIFLRHDGHYLFWVFPSLMLSTVGMDWIINVGSVRVKNTALNLTRTNWVVAPYTILSAAGTPFNRSLTAPDNQSSRCSTRPRSHHLNLVILRRKSRLVPA